MLWHLEVLDEEADTRGSCVEIDQEKEAAGEEPTIWGQETHVDNFLFFSIQDKVEITTDRDSSTSLR